VQRALTTYQHPDRWKRLQLNAMEKNFSWDVSAKEYKAIYDQLCPQA